MSRAVVLTLGACRLTGQQLKDPPAHLKGPPRCSSAAYKIQLVPCSLCA